MDVGVDIVCTFVRDEDISFIHSLKKYKQKYKQHSKATIFQ